jgi:hypothetical protein
MSYVREGILGSGSQKVLFYIMPEQGRLPPQPGSVPGKPDEKLLSIEGTDTEAEQCAEKLIIRKRKLQNASAQLRKMDLTFWNVV